MHLEAFPDKLWITVLGNHYYPQRREGGPKDRDNLQPIEYGHIEIQQQDIRGDLRKNFQ